MLPGVPFNVLTRNEHNIIRNKIADIGCVSTVQTIFCTLTIHFSAPLYSCFMSTDVGYHKFRLFVPFIMKIIKIVFSGLDFTLCFCFSCNIMICGSIKKCLFYFHSTSRACISHVIWSMQFMTIKLLSLLLSFYHRSCGLQLLNLVLTLTKV